MNLFFLLFAITEVRDDLMMTIYGNKYLAFGLTETTVCIVATFFTVMRNVKFLEAGNTVDSVIHRFSVFQSDL